MNKYQKEVEKEKLKNEKITLKSLENIYIEATRDIKKEIQKLNQQIEKLIQDKTQNESLIRSKIYQAKYQKILLENTESTFKILKDKNTKTIEDFLKKMYEDGYLGQIYNLHQNNIPVYMPVNPNKLIKSVYKDIDDMKFSKRLYKDLNKTKKDVIHEISRGIATGQSNQEIGRNISNRLNISLRKSYTIARTEGARVSIEATIESMNKSKEKGADIVKQWDSTLDNKTRPTHRELDGKWVETDEKFKYSGGEVNAPTQFGKASEDINCRCALLSIPRWDIDDTYIKRDNITGEIIEAKNYQDWKEKYHKELTKIDKEEKTKIIKEAIEGQTELLKKYGNLTNIMLKGSSEDMLKWSELQKISNKSEKDILLELSSNAKNWETILLNQSESTLKPFIDQLYDIASDEELSALRFWTGNSYANINKYMRYGINVDKISKNAAKTIEQVLGKIKTPEEIIVRRGTATKEIFAKITEDWKSDPKVLIGKEFKDMGFTATSPFKDGGFSGIGQSQAELFIKVPKGTHGAYIGDNSYNELEKEFLLQKGYTYRIIEAEYRPNERFLGKFDLKVWCEVILDE